MFNFEVICKMIWLSLTSTQLPKRGFKILNGHCKTYNADYGFIKSVYNV